MWFKSKKIYLDYASATPVLPEAVRAFRHAIEKYGNPSAIHAEGVEARALLEGAREKLALLLGVKARDIIFTSGATEANNLAILGRFKRLVLSGKKPGETHWVVSAIEHPSVLTCLDHIAEMGGSVSRVYPDKHGLIAEEAVGKLLKPETVFVSIGWANHEIGTIQPLSRIARLLRAHEQKYKSIIIFHSDAGQAPLYISPQIHTLGVDLMTFDAGKLYAPRGIGMCVGTRHLGKEGALLSPIILGGGQEWGMRAGTENPALASAFAKAFEHISHEREKEARRVRLLRDELARQLQAHVPGIIINNDTKHALPHMLNISIPNSASWRTSEYLLLQLDQAGISISTKSACKEGEQASSVVRMLGGDPLAGGWRAENTLRFSLGRDTNSRDIQKTLNILIQLLNQR